MGFPPVCEVAPEYYVLIIECWSAKDTNGLNESQRKTPKREPRQFREWLMKACVVHSQDVDSVDAVAELIAGAQVALGASLPRVAMLFAGIDHDFAVVLEL